MRRIIVVLLAVFIVFIFISCSTVNVEAPDNSYAYLMPDQEKYQVKEVRTQMNFYLLWGLVPLGDNSTRDLIQPKEKVKVTTYTSFLNWLINGIGSNVTVISTTTEVDVIK